MHFTHKDISEQPSIFLNSGEYTVEICGWADIANDEGALVAVLVDRKSLGMVEVRSNGVYKVDI